MNEMNVPRPNNLDAFWMPYSDNKLLQGQSADARAGRGHVLLHRRWARRSWTAPRASGAATPGMAGVQIKEAIQKQAAILDYAPDLPARPPHRLRGRGAHRRADAGRHGQGLLHQLRLRERRHRAEDRAGLPQGARREQPGAADRAGARLSRGRLRRHVGRRHRRQPQAVRRPAALCGPPAAYPWHRGATASPRACRRKARISPMRWRTWSRCMAPRPSPR